MLSKPIHIIFLLSFGLFLLSCAKKKDIPLPDHAVSGAGYPPAYVQKAWDARYTYDPDRRLLVPQYAGSRWGAVQQYKEEGLLEYQDWWIRDVRSEDLEAAPDTFITSYLDDDGNVTEVILKSEDEVDEEELESSGSENENSEKSDVGVEDSPFPPAAEDDLFEPSPFSPF